MLGIFRWIWSGLKAIGNALILPFSKVKSSSRLQSVCRWSVHFACLTGALTGLYFLNQSMHLDTVLRAPSQWLRSAWLPILAFQVYLLSWIGWWLCRTATTKRVDSEHPDLDSAWKRVAAALEIANIDIRNTPLFLMLGQPSQPMASFFNAGQVPRKIPVAPKDPDAAFHLYANDEAIYFCLEETSLLGRQAAMFNASAQRNRETQIHSNANSYSGPAAHEFSPAESASSFASATNNGLVNGGREIGGPGGSALVATASSGANPHQTATALETKPLSPAPPAGLSSHQIEQRSLNVIESNIALANDPELLRRTVTMPAAQGVYQPATQIKVPILQNDLEIETTLSRLNYLCELVHQARHPICPINGVVVLIPFAATENEEVANHVGMLIEQDLETVRSGTMVDAAKIAVLCDIQAAEGCTELLSRFPQQQRHRRLGIRFPQVPACDLEQYRQMISDGINWLCLKMVPPLVNRLFSAETLEQRDSSDEVANRKLYQFTKALRDRQSKIERVVRRAFLGNGKREGLLRGLYLSASGIDSVNEHGFTAGIFSQVNDLQSDISWTPEAIERDSDFNRWTKFGYAGIASVVLIVLACLVL